MTIFPLLTGRQALVWSLKLRGLRNADIASRLGISRQAVSKLLSAAELKIVRALLAAAQANRVEVRRLYPDRGILVGYSHALKQEVVITFSASNGVYVWYRHEGNCERCPLREECRRILLREAEERGISLNREEISMPPSRLAEAIFRKMGVIG